MSVLLFRSLYCLFFSLGHCIVCSSFWSLYCLFFDLRLLIIPLVSSNFSYQSFLFNRNLTRNMCTCKWHTSVYRHRGYDRWNGLSMHIQPTLYYLRDSKGGKYIYGDRKLLALYLTTFLIIENRIYFVKMQYMYDLFLYGRRLSKLFNLCLILLSFWTIKYVKKNNNKTETKICFLSEKYHRC